MERKYQELRECVTITKSRPGVLECFYLSQNLQIDGCCSECYIKRKLFTPGMHNNRVPSEEDANIVD